MGGIGSCVPGISDHPDSRGRGRRIRTVRHSPSKVLQLLNGSRGFGGGPSVQVERVTRRKGQGLPAYRRNRLKDSIGVVGVVNHEQVTWVDRDACSTERHATWT